MPGGGYFSRAVLSDRGPSGHLYTVSVNRAIKRDPPPPDAATPSRSAAESLHQYHGSQCRRCMSSSCRPISTSSGPRENYHDLHNAMFGKPDMKVLDRAVFNALKPGGVFIVEDHAAAAGSGARDTDTLHRIDPELVKQELTSVGFVFAGRSDVLHNAEDAHDHQGVRAQGPQRQIPVQVPQAAALTGAEQRAA